MQEKELQPQENKMGVLPVNKLLVTMSVPIMLSMLVQALYNIVDSIFVSRVSENALNAVGLAFPVQNLMIAVATGTGVGINALLSKSLGEKRFERANLTASNGVFLGVCSAAAFAVLGALFSGTFFQVQTDVEEIVAGGTAYIQICTVGSFGLFLSISIERLLQATGRTVYSMVTQMAGALTNIIFDPIFIFVFDMGIAGAAWATVLGQVVGASLGVYFNARKNPEITLTFKGFRPNGFIIRRIYSVGVPSIIMASIGSVMTFGLNKILIGLQTTATAVLGVYFKLQSFVFMPVFGLNNGMVPIVAYNFGADAGNRRSRPADHQPPFCPGGLRHRLLVLLPGIGPRDAEPRHLPGAAADRAAAGGVAAEPVGAGGGGLVGVPYRGGVLRYAERAVSDLRPA